MISVILPAYNAQETIGEAIQSIINQTYTDWELLVINDGSTDNTKAVILSFTDPRIKYFENEGNKKLIYTLNRGLELANGKYIARMDADDIAEPERYSLQLAYMESHPECIVCGTYATTFGKKMRNRLLKWHETDEDIRNNYLLLSPVIHPTAFIRNDVLKRSGVKYDASYPDAEDYKFWLDLMDYGKFHNIPESLLNYRISPTQVTQDNNIVQIESTKRARNIFLEKYLSKETFIIYKENGVNLKFIKKYKEGDWNYATLQAFYFSISPFDISSILYYFATLDFLHYNWKDVLRQIKRFVGLRPSLL